MSCLLLSHWPKLSLTSLEPKLLIFHKGAWQVNSSGRDVYPSCRKREWIIGNNNTMCLCLIHSDLCCSQWRWRPKCCLCWLQEGLVLPKSSITCWFGFQKAQAIELSVEGRGWSERWVLWKKQRGRGSESLGERFYSSSLKKEEDLGGSGGEERWTSCLKCFKNQLKFAALQREGKTHSSLHLRCSWGGQDTSMRSPAWCKLGSPCA